MNKEYILNSAKLLKKASNSACDEFSLKSDKLISEMNLEMLKTCWIFSAYYGYFF